MTITSVPVLVAPPVSPAVTLAALKEHLTVEHGEHDAMITAFGAAATAHLDGWRGVLGRAIMPQTWACEFGGWGVLRLPMPDASGFTVEWWDGAAFVAQPTFEAAADSRGPFVVAEGPATSRVRVAAIYGLPAGQLDRAQTAIKLLAAHWYENREAVTVGVSTAETPFAVEALIAALRWRNI